MSPLLRSALIALPFVIMSFVIAVLIGIEAHKERKQFESTQLDLIETHNRDIESLKLSHAEEIKQLKNELTACHVEIDRLQRIAKRPVFIDYKNPATVMNISDHNAEIEALRAEHEHDLETQRSQYEKRIEDLKTIQLLRLEANLKARDTEHRAEIKKLKERENRLAIIIRELIEASCDCEFPFEMLPGSSSPVPCVYVTKDKIWHITKHRTVSDARTMALHEALLKGYGGCPRCMKNLPPYFRF